MQNKYNDRDCAEKAQTLLDRMEEYSREHLAERIGKATLDQQEDVRGKQKAEKQIDDLINYKTNDKGIDISE